MFLEDLRLSKLEIFLPTGNCGVWKEKLPSQKRLSPQNSLDTALASQENVRHFYSCRPFQAKLSSRFLSSPPRQREITYPPGSVFSKIDLPLAETGVRKL